VAMFRHLRSASCTTSVTCWNLQMEMPRRPMCRRTLALAALGRSVAMLLMTRSDTLISYIRITVILNDEITQQHIDIWLVIR